MFSKKTYSNWNELPVLINLEQAAVLLGVGVDCVRKYCIAKELPAVQIGRQWHIDKQKLMEKFGYM